MAAQGHVWLAGAEVVGSEDLIAAIQKGGAGAIDFDKCLATSAMMSKLARVARTLGPRGLMPNPKLGTIVDTSNIAEAVRTMKAGRVEFRCGSPPYPGLVFQSPALAWPHPSNLLSPNGEDLTPSWAASATDQSAWSACLIRVLQLSAQPNILKTKVCCATMHAERGRSGDSGVQDTKDVHTVRLLDEGSDVVCRADRGAVLHAAVGKVDFPVEHLHANLGALTAAVLAARPKGIKGGGEPCFTLATLCTCLLSSQALRVPRTILLDVISA